MVLVVEVEAARAHLDELFHHTFIRHVAKHDILWVVRKDCKPVRDARWVLLFLLFQLLFELFVRLGVREFRMSRDFTNKTIAWYDVSFNNFAQAFKV